MTERIFGTDGIRGEAGTGWLELERVSALGRALGRVLGSRANSKTAILGHDGRESGPAIAAALARGLAEAGFSSTSAGLITTPGLAIVASLNKFGLGVMISASHNPAKDNGIKVFASEGAKLTDELEIEIEAEALANPDPAEVTYELKEDRALTKLYIEYLVKQAGRTGLRERRRQPHRTRGYRTLGRPGHPPRRESGRHEHQSWLRIDASGGPTGARETRRGTDWNRTRRRW